MAEDERKVGFEVAIDLDPGDDYVWSVGALRDRADGLPAPLDYVLGNALEEDLADELGLGELGARGEPWCVEGVGQREVLLGDYATGDALRESERLAVHTMGEAWIAGGKGLRISRAYS